MSRVLVVDDDDTIAGVLADYLRRAGHDAVRVGDGPAALSHIAADRPDLVVLDLMLPGLDGLEVCRRVRSSRPDLPVIMLTALGEAEDRIAGLEVGADDYVTKPFSPRELVLRIESVLRRAAPARHDGASRPERHDGAPRPERHDGAPGRQRHDGARRVGPLTVDRAARRAARDGAELNLTARELDLLAFLAEHPDIAFTREQLMREVWGWTFGDRSTVTVHVRRLREKIEDDPRNPTLIRTVWGVGYRLETP